MIKQIRLIGCQSWEDITINISADKLNVISAENNVGKSVLFKILKLAACPNFYSKEDRCKLIRWGEECATAMFAGISGSISMMKIYPDRTIYAYKEKNEKGFHTTLEPSKEMLVEIGLIADSAGAFVANLIDTDQDLLLVNSNLSSNNDLIQMLVYNEDLENVQNRILPIQRELNQKDQYLKQKLINIDDRIHSRGYIDIESEQKTLSDVIVTKEYFGISAKIDDVLHTLIDTMVYQKDYSLLQVCQEALADFENMNFLMAVQPNTIPVAFEIMDCMQLFEDIMNNLRHCYSIVAYDIANEDFFEDLKYLEDLTCMMAIQCNELQKQLELVPVIEDLNKKYLASGTVFACPIYREVVFDGKNCVPRNP